MRCKECRLPMAFGIPVREVPPYGPIQEFVICPVCFSTKVRAEVEKHKERESIVAAFIDAVIPPGTAAKKPSIPPNQT